MDKLPPQNLEAERAVLGSLLIEPSAIHTVVELVTPAHFYSDAHQKIFSAIIQLFDQSKPIDMLLIIEKLDREQQLDSVGGQGYIASLISSVSSAAHVEHYAHIVKEKAILRSLISNSTSTITECYQSDESPDMLLDRAEQRIFEIAQDRIKTGFQHVGDHIHETVDRMEAFFKDKKKVTGIPTGFAEFDTLTAGLQPSNLIVVAGRPSMGKTSFCLNIAQHVGIREKLPVAVFSLEMSREELVFRMVCSEARVNAHHARTGFLSKDTWHPITSAAERLSEAPIFIDDSPSLSVLEMKSRARRLKAEKGLSLIIIDYLQLMTGRTGKAEYRQQDVSDMTRALKILAKDLHVPVITLSQLSRAPEKRTSPRPQLADLRESGAIEQDADVVAFLYREGYYKPDQPELENKAEVIIGKQRNGPTGTIELIFNRECTRFENKSNVAE